MYESVTGEFGGGVKVLRAGVCMRGENTPKRNVVGYGLPGLQGSGCVLHGGGHVCRKRRVPIHGGRSGECVLQGGFLNVKLGDFCACVLHDGAGS